MNFTFPHLHGNKFSGLCNYELSFQLGKPEGFCFGQRIKKADPIRGLGQAARCAGFASSFILNLLHDLRPSPRSSVRLVSLVLVFLVRLIFPPQGFKGAPVASEVRLPSLGVCLLWRSSAESRTAGAE